LTLAGFLLTIAISICLYVFIPKGFFPQEDTGSLVGAAVAADSISYEEMTKKTSQIADIVRSDPDVLTFTYNVHSSSLNTAYFFLNLRSFDEGRKISADQVIARLRPQIARLTGVNLFLQTVQDVTIGARLLAATDRCRDRSSEWRLHGGRGYRSRSGCAVRHSTGVD
jgi:HAE1 family hydrophobic/amphiphilic exporter-1